MSDEVQTISVVRDTTATVARQQLGEATSSVQYVSKGHCLIIGNADRALPIAESANFKSTTIVQISDAVTEVDKNLADSRVACFTVPFLHLDGFLGAFKAVVPESAGTLSADYDIGVSVYLESGLFDLVLDISEKPVLGMQLPPFGYKHALTDKEICAAIDDLGQLTGEFDKPRYFEYNASICAHSRSELDGCTRCIDVCSTGAIISDGEGVLVNPFLCQGCGSCATICPSGAMTYAYPRPSDAINRSRQALTSRSACVVLLHTDSHHESIEKASLNNAIVPMLVEEVSAFGADYWLSMLAGPACRIVLLTDASPDDPERRALKTQINMVHELLAGLGIDEQVISMISPIELSRHDTVCLQPESFLKSSLRQLPSADFSTHNDKRQTIRLALDSLVAAFSPKQASVELSAGAPFGHIEVDKQACTLCMACVSTCPAKALLDGQDTPALRMVEANCLQCGLCEQACPESAITLHSRYTWDSVTARRIEPLNEEEPFHCLQCHEPFTTKSMIDTMSEKLTGHWMFQDEKAMRRLQLCGDCRVRDMFEQNNAGIDVRKHTV